MDRPTRQVRHHGLEAAKVVLVVLTAAGCSSADAGTTEDGHSADSGALDEAAAEAGAIGDGAVGDSAVGIDAAARTDAAAGIDGGRADSSSGRDSATEAGNDAGDGGIVEAACPSSLHSLYVATTGSDSNPGTQSAPFKTILAASRAAMPDTTIHVAAGTYTGGFQTTSSGTSSARICYVSDALPGAKIVPPKSSSTDMGWDNRGAYVTISGFEVDGSVDPTSGKVWTVGINVGGQGDVVDHCHAHHIYNSGTGNSSGGAGILLDSWYGFNDMQALGNVVDHVGPSSGVGGNWYQGIYQTATGAIKNNIAYAVTGAGIHLWHDANHIDIANNTSFGNGIGFVVGGGDFVHTMGPCDYITVTNNIAFDNTSMGFDEEGKCGTHNLFTNDLSFQNGTNWRLLFSSHTDDVTAGPQFVSYERAGGGDYHLAASSPAIDKGVSTYAPPVDFDGFARPYGPAVDIGAYEWHP